MNQPRIEGEDPQHRTGRPPTADCGDDPVAALKTMFVDLVMGSRISAGQDPVLRPVFLKPHGVAHGTFTVRPDLPEHLRVGLFQHAEFPAWVRFSSDTLPTLPDLRTTVGIAIKLFDVPGEKLLEPEEDATTHDFLLQNHDVFFVDTARDMCEFTRQASWTATTAPTCVSTRRRRGSSTRWRRSSRAWPRRPTGAGCPTASGRTST